VVIPTYRVRYRLGPAGQQQAGRDVQTVDLQTDLDGIPARLPLGAYIMYVEELEAGRPVHWTRWPKAYRPGAGG
jgi:hypothetical protein